MSTTVTPTPVEGESPPTTTAEPTEAPKPRSTGQKATTAKPKGKPATGKKASRYPDWVPSAVVAARHLSGMKPGQPGDKTMAYAGPSQHIKVREHVTKALDGNVSPDAILKLTGIKSHKLLREIATWSADKSEMTPMRPLSKVFAPDAWAQGRYLAAILVAWTDELRRSAKS